ncbi:hypothetical protein ACFQ15_05830 [Sphingomonas hankookensis]|uniref:hypothetical protein n=1 Tax=Sphingomonas hankookensis TaxID=563996 RepID=UPI001F594477|nr:hypothetical protein [Sphingomonas hankookensis]
MQVLNPAAVAAVEEITAAVLAAVRKEMPRPASAVPRPERTGAAIGEEPNQYAWGDHQHPRLTSVTAGTAAVPGSHTIKSDGLSPPIIFTRLFTSEPGVDIMPIKPSASDILLPPYVAEWVMGTGADADKFAGVVIGWRKLQMTTTTATVLNVTLLASNAPTQVPAAGVRFSCIAVARSDMS